MAAVEEASVVPSLTSQVPPVTFKNTARKSTSKPPQVWPPSSPSPELSLNGSVVETNLPLANGEVATKRRAETEDVVDQAKVARLQVEEMECPQEEMMQKVTQDNLAASLLESNGSSDNGLSNGEIKALDQSSQLSKLDDTSANDIDNNGQDNVKLNSESVPNSEMKNAFAITANMKDSFKGILNVAMAKLSSHSAPSSGPSSTTSSRSSTPDIKMIRQSLQSSQTTSSVGAMNKGNLFEKLSSLAEESNLTDKNSEDAAQSDASIEKVSATSESHENGVNLISDDEEANNLEHEEPVIINSSLEGKLLLDSSECEEDSDVDESVLDEPKPMEDGSENSMENGTEGKDNLSLCDKDLDTPDKETCDIVKGDQRPVSPKVKEDEEKGEGESQEKVVDLSEGEEQLSESNDKEADPTETHESASPGSSNAKEEDTEPQKESDEEPCTQSVVEETKAGSTESSDDAPTQETLPGLGEPEAGHMEEDLLDAHPVEQEDNTEGKPMELDDSAEDERSDVDRPATPDRDSLSHDCEAKSETSESGAKKRGPSSPLSSDSTPDVKKSRLDQVIGRLGSAIGIKPDEVQEDDAEDDDDDEEAGKGSDVLSDAAAAKVSSPVSPEDVKDEEVKEAAEAKSEEELKMEVVTEEPKKEEKVEEDDTKADVKPDVKKPNAAGVITLTAEELNDLLVRRMTAFLETSRGSLVTSLQRRVQELQSSVEVWRSHSKQLALQVTELSAKQTVRKRTSARHVLKRNMSVQVDDKSQMQVAMLHNVGSGQVTIRTPTRSGGAASKSNSSSISSSTQPTPIAPAPLRSPATVRDLLDKQRNAEGPVISSTPITTTKTIGKSQTVTIPPGSRIMVSGAQILPRGTLVNAVRQPGVGTTMVTRQQPVTVVKGVIDLTDDDEARNKEGKTMIRTLQQGGTAQLVQPQVAVRHGAPITHGGTAIRPGAVLVQQTPNSTPVLVQQSLRAAPGTTFVYTSARPGTMVVPTAPGTSLVRPAATAPPTLRPAGQLIAVQRPAGTTTTTVVNRPPPPLKSAPQQATHGVKHPAPLPPQPAHQPIGVAGPKQPPPKPGLKISRVQQGIVLSWNMNLSDSIAEISNYQLFAYQETSAPPSTSLWKKVGDVKALPLPMACTLTQFQEGNKYHFSVRAVDIHDRVGPLSDPSSIALTAINVS